MKNVTLFESDDEAGVARVLLLIEKVTSGTATVNEQWELDGILEAEYQRQQAQKRANEEQMQEAWKLHQEAMGYTVSKGVN